MYVQDIKHNVLPETTKFHPIHGRKGCQVILSGCYGFVMKAIHSLSLKASKDRLKKPSHVRILITAYGLSNHIVAQ